VARLAGLPSKAVKRAEAVLKMLEERGRSGGAMTDLPLFAAAHEASSYDETCHENVTRDAVRHETVIIDALVALDPDALSPKDALNALYRLKSLLNGV
jgi:DNA mismatch repair protein MutS